MDIKSYISSGIIEAYALGTTSPEESSILECVMSNNAEVKAAVLQAQTTFEKMATISAVEPPAFVKEEIVKKINFNEEKIEETPIISLPKRSQSSDRNFSMWMKAASVAAFLGIGYLTIQLSSTQKELQQTAQTNTDLALKVNSLEEMNSLMKNSRRIELKGVEKHPDLLADVYWHTSKKVFLEIKNLPSAPAGHQYQLWAIVEGKPVDMGMYTGKEVQEMKSVDKAEAFAITLEKEGGNTTPTMEELYVMGSI